ncbi:MAG: hypothetical protein JNK23_10455 [Opitutaceae bacterium]|nr:hypothetical protein [Opitutaceae bacterium]
MRTHLYLVLERPQRRRWRGVQIVSIARRMPVLKKPSEQAVLKIALDIPDNALEPREVRVEVKPEHIIAPVVTVKSEAPS